MYSKTRLKLIIILCFSSVPYMFSLNGDFVFDDSEAIVKNKDVFGSGDYWGDFFYNDFWGTNITSNSSHKSYRPLTILSFKNRKNTTRHGILTLIVGIGLLFFLLLVTELNYLLSGRKLVAYHFKITNLLCHVLCSLLAWQVFQILFKTKGEQTFWTDKAFLSALLFSVHPIHVEAVSGIVGRADILAGITFLLAFLAYDKIASMKKENFKHMYLLIVTILAGISMFCKENGVTVLGFCLFHELVTRFFILIDKNKTDTSTEANKALISQSTLRAMVLTSAATYLCKARWEINGRTQPVFKAIDNPAAFANDGITKIATYSYIYFLNAVLLIWPQWLCYDWSMGCIPLIKVDRDKWDYRIFGIIAILIYGLLILKCLISRRHKDDTKRQTMVSLALIMIPFLPAANIFFPVGFVIAERILYIPSAGYCAIVVLGLTKLIRRKFIGKIAAFFYCILILTFSLRTWQRSLDWQTEYSLFTSGLEVCPLNAKVHYNVAKVADAEQNTDWALEEYKTAISLYPEYYQAMNNLANLLKNQKQYEEAETYLRKALSLKQDFPAAWMNLGIVLANTKRFQESQHAYERALKYRRKYPDCYYNIGNLYLEMKNSKLAVQAWSQAIKLSPKHNLAWTNILAHLDNTGQTQQALKIIPKALEQLPNSASVHFATANIYGKMERYDDAERHFLRAIELFGGAVQAIHYANLGVLYHRWKKYSQAKEMYDKALIINPEFKSALRNLNSVVKHLK